MPTSGLIISGLSKPSLYDIRFSHKHFFKLHLHLHLSDAFIQNDLQLKKYIFFVIKQKKKYIYY